MVTLLTTGLSSRTCLAPNLGSPAGSSVLSTVAMPLSCTAPADAAAQGRQVDRDQRCSGHTFAAAPVTLACVHRAEVLTTAARWAPCWSTMPPVVQRLHLDATSMLCVLEGECHEYGEQAERRQLPPTVCASSIANTWPRHSAHGPKQIIYHITAAWTAHHRFDCWLVVLASSGVGEVLNSARVMIWEWCCRRHSPR